MNKITSYKYLKTNYRGLFFMAEKKILLRDGKNIGVNEAESLQKNSILLEKKLQSIGALSAVAQLRKSSLLSNKQCAFFGI